jgi:hypothetical protein
VAATLDGALWSVELDAPVDPGDYLLVWMTGDPEPPEFEAFLPLMVTAAALVADVDFPTVDEGAVRPAVEKIANLANARTAGGGGGEISAFDETTDPTAAQVETLIDDGVEAVLAQLPLRFSTDHYDRVRHAVALYTLILMEGSFFREQVDSGSTELWRNLFSSAMASLNRRIEEERQQARLLGAMEPRAEVIS